MLADTVEPLEVPWRSKTRTLHVGCISFILTFKWAFLIIPGTVHCNPSVSFVILSVFYNLLWLELSSFLFGNTLTLKTLLSFLFSSISPFLFFSFSNMSGRLREFQRLLKIWFLKLAGETWGFIKLHLDGSWLAPILWDLKQTLFSQLFS